MLYYDILRRQSLEFTTDEKAYQNLHPCAASEERGGQDLSLWANPHENDRPNFSAPPIRTAAWKAEAHHLLIPAFVTRSL